MKVRDVPLSGFIARNHPVLYEMPVGDALGSVTRQIRNGWSLREFRAQQELTGQMTELIQNMHWNNGEVLIQIGANDGEFDDPLRPILKDSFIPAILVEPIDVAFNALQNLYHDHPHINPVHTAIARNSRTVSLQVPVIEGRELRTSVWTCKNEIQALREVRRNLGRRCLANTIIKHMDVPALSATELLKNCGVEPSDVQVIVCDTEGQDIDIIKSFLDAGSLPSLIYYEHLHTNSEEGNNMSDQLKHVGYSITKTRKDILAQFNS